MRYAGGALLFAPLVALGCGGDSDGPTQPTVRTYTYEAMQEGPVAAHSSLCIDFRPDASGPVYAHAGLPTPIELGTGRCAGARVVVARSDTGEVNATLPAGDNFVSLENRSDDSTRYRLTLRYQMLY